MRFLALILAACALLALCTGCAGTEVQKTVKNEEPESTPEPVYGYTAEYTEVDAGLSVLTPVFADSTGFYCVSLEKTGEEIPEKVVREAQKKNREPYNDGRYDVLAVKLWRIGTDGTAEELSGYTPLTPEDNSSVWKDYSCVTGFEAMARAPDGALLTLEYNAVSGNSAPDRRADAVPGVNYLEYEVIWYLRTLDETGAQVSSRKLTGGREEALETLRKKAGAASAMLVPSEELPFTWEEAGADGDRVVSHVLKTDENTWCFLTGDGRAEELATVSLREREREKTVLRIAADTDSVLLRKAAGEFNASQDDIVLVIESYEDAAAGTADIFCLTADTCVSMGRAGMLADLYPFLDADPELDRKNYFANILSALEVNGCLYSTCAGFSVDTVIGASSVVGERSGWTYDDLTRAWGEFGIGTDAFARYTTSGDVLGACLSMDLDRFIDWEAGTCSFTDEAFTRMLFFSGNFPRTFDYAGHVWSDADSSDLRIRRGRQMLQEVTLNNFGDALVCGFEFGGEITYIGYPTAEGNGSLLRVSTLDTGVNLGISASSEHPQEAWSFLRTFFTEEYQESYWYFPVNTNVFSRLLSKAMKTDYVLDQKGNIVYDKVTNKPAVQSVDTIYLSNFTPVAVYPISDERAEKLVDLVSSAGKIIRDNGDICAVVTDSVQGYYTGSLSLYEAADAAQAAVTGYLEVLRNTETEEPAA